MTRKTKDARKRSLRPYILVGRYTRPSDPELAARWDANEAEYTACQDELKAILDPHRDEYGSLPFTEDDDGYDRATPLAEFLTAAEAARVEELHTKSDEAAKRRTCGCLVHERIWLSDWTESAMYSTISVNEP